MTEKKKQTESQAEVLERLAALEAENKYLRTETENLNNSCEIRDRLAKQNYMKAKEVTMYAICCL